MTGAAFIDTLNAWSTFGAAAATTISAMFIAWQILLTRKSVQATDQTLRVAMDEFEHSRLLRVDAQRAAIDAEMPKLFVSISRDLSTVEATDDREPEPLAYLGSRPRRVPVGTEYVFPRDANVRLEVSISVAVSNDGPRRAAVQVDSPYSANRRLQRRLLAAGESVALAISRTATVGEWVDIAERRARGESEEVTVSTVIYIFPGDTGATERHEIAQGGSVLEPVPDHSGAWRVRDLKDRESLARNPMGSGVQPFTREYWASRSGERRLEGMSGGNAQERPR